MDIRVFPIIPDNDIKLPLELKKCSVNNLGHS